GRGGGRQRRGGAVLVDDLEAGDGGQARGRPVGGQVAGGGRVVVRVDQGDRAAGAVRGGGRGQGVGRLQLGGAVADAGRDGVRRYARGHRVDAVPLEREAGLPADDDHGADMTEAGVGRRQRRLGGVSVVRRLRGDQGGPRGRRGS